VFVAATCYQQVQDRYWDASQSPGLSKPLLPTTVRARTKQIKAKHLLDNILTGNKNKYREVFFSGNEFIVIRASDGDIDYASIGSVFMRQECIFFS
jgi:hypothetical protein